MPKCPFHSTSLVSITFTMETIVPLSLNSRFFSVWDYQTNFNNGNKQSGKITINEYRKDKYWRIEIRLKIAFSASKNLPVSRGFLWGWENNAILSLDFAALGWNAVWGQAVPLLISRESINISLPFTQLYYEMSYGKLLNIYAFVLKGYCKLYTLRGREVRQILFPSF